MDFSLLQFHSRNYWLRDILALKKRWPYYFIMIIDPILRFSWVLYVIQPKDSNHSTVFSFGVALLEVTRRGMWALFRVENEHCANVGQYKASRDVPLPYRIEPLMTHTTSVESSPEIPSNGTQPDEGKNKPQHMRDYANAQRGKQYEDADGDYKDSPPNSSSGPGPSTASSTQPLSPAAAAHLQNSDQRQNVHRQSSATSGGGRRHGSGRGFSTATSTTAVASGSQSTFRRRTDSVRTFSKMLADAHTQDFEKKRKKRRESGADGDLAGDEAAVESDEADSDDDVDDDSEDEQLVREVSRLRRREDGSVIVEEDV